MTTTSNQNCPSMFFVLYSIQSLRPVSIYSVVISFSLFFPGVESEAFRWLKQNNKVTVTTDQAQQTYFDSVRSSVEFDIMLNNIYLELK
jgi:hypothetical protein